MRTRVLLALALALAGGPIAFAAPSDPVVVVLRLEGVVDPLVADYVRNGIARASDEGAVAVVLEIDTPGGLDGSMRSITEAMLDARVPVIAYVTPPGARAASAGAFIALAAPVAAMAPGTNIGASTPVGLDGGDLSTKTRNDAAAYLRSLAETYGRDGAVAETFVTQGRSLSAEQAREASVVDLVAPTRAALLAELDGKAVRLASGRTLTLDVDGVVVEERPMGGLWNLLHELLDPNLAFIAFWLGLALIVLELLIPGHVFSGTVGTVLLLIALFAFGVLPVSWIGLLLLVTSVVLFVIELNAPGLGAAGIAATVALVLGGWFLFDRSGGVAVSPLVLAPTAALVAAFFGVVVAKVLRMRDLPPVQGPEAIVGREGVVVGVGVDPRGGVVRVAAEEWRATCASGALAPGTRIRVTGIDGLVLTVEPLDADASGQAPPVTDGEPTTASVHEGGER